MTEFTFHNCLKETLSNTFLNTTFISFEFLKEKIRGRIDIKMKSLIVGELKQDENTAVLPIVFDFGDIQEEYVLKFKVTLSKAKNPIIKTSKPIDNRRWLLYSIE